MQFPDQQPSVLDTAAQVKAAQDAASSAQTLAYVGIGLGVLGIVVGALSFMRAR